MIKKITAVILSSALCICVMMFGTLYGEDYLMNARAVSSPCQFIVSDAEIMQGDKEASFTLSVNEPENIMCICGYITYTSDTKITALGDGEYGSDFIYYNPIENPLALNFDAATTEREPVFRKYAKSCYEAAGIEPEGKLATYICLEYNSLSGFSKSGSLINFTLDTSGLLPGEYTVYFCVDGRNTNDTDLKKVDFEAVHGKLTVKGNPDNNVTGDVNGDGRFDISDLLLLKKYIAGSDRTYADVITEFCDMNGDGRITALDVMMLKKIISE